MNKLTTSLIAALLLASTACRSESSRQASIAADEVANKREDMAEQSQKLAKEGAELVRAETEFLMRRDLRFQTLRAVHSVIGTQPMLISTMATSFLLTDQGRADINNKLTAFQQRLDEAANQIQGLQNADAYQWEERDDEATDAMQRLEDARQAAWKALDDAPRVIDHAAS